MLKRLVVSKRKGFPKCGAKQHLSPKLYLLGKNMHNQFHSPAALIGEGGGVYDSGKGGVDLVNARHAC